MSAPINVLYNILNHPERLEELMQATGKTREEIADLLESMNTERETNPANFTFIERRKV